MESRKKLLVTGFIVGALWPAAVPMGETAESAEKEPVFVDLEENQKQLKGYVVDEGTQTNLTQISFYGDTSVRGILSETSDSSIELDLADIKSLIVSQENYTSKRYPQKDVVQVKVVDQKSETHEFLFPRRLTICGRDASNFGHSWYIFQINELHITEEMPPATIPGAKSSDKVALLNKKVAKKG